MSPERRIDWSLLWAAVIIGLVLAFLGMRSAEAAPACAVQVLTPSALAPMRYVKLRTIVEPDEKNRGGRVALYGPEGDEETASGIHTDSRTKQIEWKNLTLVPGDYQVRLTVDDEMGKARCVATGRIMVAGSID
jgi:hypothetical protein